MGREALGVVVQECKAFQPHMRLLALPPLGTQSTLQLTLDTSEHQLQLI